jgi:hypothetical protein
LARRNRPDGPPGRILMSLFAKSLFAWQVFSGTLRPGG